MKNPLIGTWKLESAEDLIDGKWQRYFGDSPKGYFSFTAEGQVSVQFMKFPLEPVDAGDTRASYLAYFGTYTVDAAAGTFTSVVEGSVNASLVGTKQTRAFRFAGSQLIVGDLVTFKRTFRKVP